jgi:hypothetical protein
MAAKKTVKVVRKDPNSVDYEKLLSLVPNDAIQEAVKEQNKKRAAAKKKPVIRRMTSWLGQWNANADKTMEEVKRMK